MLVHVRVAVARGLNALKSDQRAVTAIEYGLIAALLAVAIIGSVSTSGKDISRTFSTVASEL